MACTKESVYTWFDEFEKFVKEHKLDSPDQIYNCDESGFPMQTVTSMKVCVDRSSRRNFHNESSSKTSITTLCVFAQMVQLFLQQYSFPERTLTQNMASVSQRIFIWALRPTVGWKRPNFTVG